MRSSSIALFAVSALCLTACQSDLPPGGFAEPVPAWNNLFSGVRRDGDIYFAGKPTQEGLAVAVDDGVTTVISLMPAAEEQKALSFDEAAEVQRLGAQFVRIPVTAESFSAADVDAFNAALAASDGKVLLHCASGNRAGAMWAAYLIRHRGISQDEALGAGVNAGLKSDAMADAVRRVASTP